MNDIFKRAGRALCLLVLMGSALTLTACNGDTQANLRKGGYDAISAYTVSAKVATAYMTLPSTTDTTKAKIKAIDNQVYPKVQTLGALLKASSTLTTTNLTDVLLPLAQLQTLLIPTASAGAPK